MNAQMIRTIQDYFKTQPVEKAWIFGSFARGEETPESDVDILVQLDYSKPIGLEYVQMQLDLQKLLSKKVDLVSTNGVSKYIKPIIDAEKMIIYEECKNS